ncbi:MAG: glycosyltransferase family 2 protein [Chlorobiaceae bacterium]|nr:glycosyltransferase family 2 protein [Chlorobiaceae bacterium]
MANTISVTVLTKNSEAYLSECLDALKPFSEVVILDNGSTDSTLAIAGRFSNVMVHEHPFIGFGPMKNLAVDKASNEWILSVDSDEIVTPELADEIAGIELDRNCLYSFVRDNYYHGRLIRGCGWGNDRVSRLFNRVTTRFNDKLIHESVEIQEGMKTVLLNGRLKHYSYEDTSQLIQKMQQYSTLWANEHQERKKTSPFKAFLYAAIAFFKSYILKKGWMDGYEGLLISVSNANGSFYKYMKLYETQRTEKL